MEIEEGPDSSTDVPPEAKGFYTKSKAIAVIITALTALITAVTALVKTTDTSLQKASYEELAESIKKISEDNGKQYDDLKAIHEYIDKDREIRKAAASAVASAIAPPTSSSVHPVAPPVMSVRPKTLAVVAQPPPPAPPTLAPKSKTVIPKDFKAVEDKAAEKPAAK